MGSGVKQPPAENFMLDTPAILHINVHNIQYDSQLTCYTYSRWGMHHPQSSDPVNIFDYFRAVDFSE